MKRLLNGLLCLFSGVGFVWACIRPDNVWLTVWSAPFFLFLCAAVHESGHGAVCLLSGGSVTQLCLPFAVLSRTGLRLRNELSFSSSCSFRCKGRQWLVYLGGPLASLLAAVPLLVWYLQTRAVTPLLYAAAAWAVVLGNVIPWGKNDGAMALRSRKP